MNHQLDATFVIDFLSGRSAARALYIQLQTDGVGLSIVTVMELWEGVASNRDPKQAEHVLREFLRGVTVLPFSRRVARRAAELRAELRRLKRPIEQRALDILIAATALTHDLTLITSDRDFDDIPGLKRLNTRAAERQP